MILAAGAPAAEAALSRSRTPVYAVLIGQKVFQDLRLRYPDAKLSAVLLDQPLERQLALMRAVLPEAQRVGVLLGPDTGALRGRLENAAAAAGLRLAAWPVSTQAEILPALERALDASDALLALPDPLAAGPGAARTILLTSYRYRRPVFAYSRAYVEAGALAAVFSTPGDVAREVADWLRGTRGGVRLPPPRPARHFDVALNRQVARALHLDLPDEATVLARLREREQP
ncbi:ABC transporter substrate-binding protein [Pseudothauera nasutitermitis]|uniref:ABC transporter substrate-binding protein n=1 Tax=Pseudothauera nasutitermitis TaxID=2565930 RepID=UPI001454DC39|nr:ABC transporter substrate binding protein [Pseudothauera nasutitermitis]